MNLRAINHSNKMREYSTLTSKLDLLARSGNLGDAKREGGDPYQCSLHSLLDLRPTP